MRARLLFDLFISTLTPSRFNRRLRYALENNLLGNLPGKTPDATMAAAMYQDLKKKKESKRVFVRPSEGRFGLREWEDDPELAHLVQTQQVNRLAETFRNAEKGEWKRPLDDKEAERRSNPEKKIQESTISESHLSGPDRVNLDALVDAAADEQHERPAIIDVNKVERNLGEKKEDEKKIQKENGEDGEESDHDEETDEEDTADTDEDTAEEEVDEPVFF